MAYVPLCATNVYTFGSEQDLGRDIPAMYVLYVPCIRMGRSAGGHQCSGTVALTSDLVARAGRVGRSTLELSCSRLFSTRQMSVFICRGVVERAHMVDVASGILGGTSARTLFGCWSLARDIACEKGFGGSHLRISVVIVGGSPCSKLPILTAKQSQGKKSYRNA